jgi:hypothetical protein
MEFATVLVGLVGFLVFLVVQKLVRLNRYLASLGVPLDRQTPFFKQYFKFFEHDVR